MSLLAVEGITVRYNSVPALRNVSFAVEEHETAAIVGANGAGKSTLTLVITGVLKPTSGSIRFEGHTISGLRPEAIARKGISLVPEGRHIFEGLTVAENLLLGSTSRANRANVAETMAYVHSLFPILEERAKSMATRLSGGEQQQLAIARALLSQPRLLILDEPSLGLSPVLADKIYDVLVRLKLLGTTLLLIEQNPTRIGKVADRVIGLSNGSVQFTTSPGMVFDSADLGFAYLGGKLAGSP